MTTTPRTPRPRISWLIVLGLAALFLLWPLTNLLGFDSGPVRALSVIGVTAVVWIGVVGLGGVPRPVLTLTLSGIAYGALGIVLALFFNGPGQWWTLVPALAMSALWGCLAGLLAAGVQHLRRSGR